MLNVNKITSMLAKMPDQQLQQYAQMHKNDPYIMSLAMSESNRRKDVRAARPPMPEQPKVVDQAVAEMAPQRLPEDQGIGQIPAGNMNFADGGIIAFADGGDVERYQVGGQTGSWVDKYLYGNITPAERERRERIQAEKSATRLRTPFEQERAANMAAAIAGSTYTPEAYNVTAPAPAFQDPRLLGATPTDTTVKVPATDDKTGQNLPAPAAKLNPTAPGGKPAAQAGLGNLDVSKLTETALTAAAKQPNPFAKDVTDIGAAKVAAKEAEVTGLQAIQDKYSDIFKGRKERLEKKEGDIETMKDQNLGLALLQAGAAMMTTRGGVGMAIGKGVDVGSRQYAAGVDKVRSAQEKLSDARDRLEEIEANRGEMSAREMLKAQNEVKTAGISAREDLLKANMQMYGINRETALKMVDNQIKVGVSMYEQDQATARTRMQVSAQRDTPDRIVFDQLLKANNNDAVKAAEALQKMKAEKFNMYEAYSKYLTGFAGKDTLTPPLAFDQFASQFAIPTTKAPGKGATILTQP